MLHEEGRRILLEILGEVRFEGHFNKCFDNIKDSQQLQIIDWARRCAAKDIGPIQSRKNRDIIGFVNRIGSSLRAILTKEKKGFFIALFLDKHKYYEDEMEKLGF